MDGGPRGGRGGRGRSTCHRSWRRTAAVTIGHKDTLDPATWPMRGPHFRPMAVLAPPVYRGGVVSSTVRSFLAEPPAPDPPTRVWRDWALLGVIATSAVLETVFREDLVWRPAGLVVCLGLSVTLLWRRTRPLIMTAIAFGGTNLLDTAARLVADEPTAVLITTAYVLLFPYALLRWGSGRDAAIGMGLILGLHAVTETAAGNFGDLILGAAFFLFSAALGA